MRILHTADWHLGKKLDQFERTDEHQDFLDWLIGTLDTEKIDVLIVAGDIFDTGSPSNTALEQYYGFLVQVKNTYCREVIIIGGNHDSISTLNAPKELLKYLNVHVIGGVPEVFADQIIPIRDRNGKIELIVCAVPFLRDRDIRLSISGETSEEREIRIKEGIQAHYHRFKEHLHPYTLEKIPIIATGHLFAAGSSTSESEKEIHVGNLGQVRGDQFPEEFNYVALGHIHRPQVVNKMEHVRYSGSPISLSFSEHEDKKLVVIVEFGANENMAVRLLQVPSNRELVRIKGTWEKVRDKILLLEDRQMKYPAWVEVQVETDSYLPDLEEQLTRLKHGKKHIEHFFPRQVRTRVLPALDQLSEEVDTLTDLDPKTVFLKKCQSELGEADITELVQTFDEALEQLRQREG